MTSKRFWQGEKVMTLVDHEHIHRGTEGIIKTRWLGTIYAVRLQDGGFHWMDSSELASINPSKHRIGEGDTVMVTSNKHQHKFTHEGDLVQVVKIIDDADYYEVLLDNEIHWLNGFELAKFI